jgi:pimeloyl-ACP methyl ester carboxylesterase
MRSLESALLVGNLMILAWCITARALTSSFRLLSVAALLLAIIQVVVEGYRWQMYPAYLVTAGLFLTRTWPGRARRGIWTSVAGLGCVLGSATLCIVLPVFEFPRPTGPFAIGSVTRHLVDPAREEPLARKPGAHRELMIQVWYPAERSGPAHFYCSRAEMPFKKEHLSRVKTPAAEGVPIARSPGRFPVLIFSPAWKGRRYQNTFQAEELASHGFVVVGLDHPYGTEITVFPDGRSIKTTLSDVFLDFSSQEALDARLRVIECQLRIRTADVRFVLDTLERLDRNDEAGLLAGHLDISRVGIFGHSFGGAVAAEACRLDPRFRAGIDLDGCLFGMTAKEGVIRPILIVGGEDSPPPTEALPLTSSLSPQSLGLAYFHANERTLIHSFEEFGGYVLQIRGTSHANFCDSPLFSPIRRLTGAGPINANRAMKIINDYTLAFFNQILNGESEALLAGPALQYPEARLEAWQPRERAPKFKFDGPTTISTRSDHKS